MKIVHARARIEPTKVGSARLYFEERGSGSVQFDRILKTAVRVRFGSVRFQALVHAA